VRSIIQAFIHALKTDRFIMQMRYSKRVGKHGKKKSDTTKPAGVLFGLTHPGLGQVFRGFRR